MSLNTSSSSDSFNIWSMKMLFWFAPSSDLALVILGFEKYSPFFVVKICDGNQFTINAVRQSQYNYAIIHSEYHEVSVAQLQGNTQSYLTDEHRKCCHASMKFRIVFGHSKEHFGLNPRLEEPFSGDLQDFMSSIQKFQIIRGLCVDFQSERSFCRCKFDSLNLSFKLCICVTCIFIYRKSNPSHTIECLLQC